MPDYLYPHFLEEAIDHRAENSNPTPTPTSLLAFSSDAKKRRCDDLVVAYSGGGVHDGSGVFLYRNPLNIDFDDGCVSIASEMGLLLIACANEVYQMKTISIDGSVQA